MNLRQRTHCDRLLPDRSRHHTLDTIFDWMPNGSLRKFTALIKTTLALGIIGFAVLGRAQAEEPAEAKPIVESTQKEAPSPADAAIESSKRVADFEKSLSNALSSHPTLSRELLNSKEFQDWLQTFFASLNDKDARLKAAAILRKRLVMNRELEAELVGSLIRDEDPGVKLAAAQAIGDMGLGARYAKEVTAFLDGKPSDGTVLTVVLAMSRVTEESLRKPIVAYLEKLTSSPDAEIRLKGVDAMIRFYAPLTRESSLQKPWPWLLPFLDDPHAFVRGKAMQALPLFGANGVELAMRMLDDKEPHVREWALRTLEEFHDPKACGAPRAVQKLDAKDASFHGTEVCPLPQSLCAKSCDAIAKRLTDPDDDVRSMAASVLGQLHATQHMAGVVPMLKDKEFTPKLRSAEAVGEKGDPSQIEKLRPLLNNPGKLGGR